MTVYSHSRLGAFESCPRKYWYAYIGKPDVLKVEGIEAFMGSRVHEALEALYAAGLGGRTMTLDEVVAVYEERWAAEWSEAVRIVKRGFTAADYCRVGRDAVAGYYRRHQPFDASRTLELEARVEVDLDGTGSHRMKGYVDRIARRADGTYEIHDYKTSAKLMRQKEADEDRQLALYQIGLAAMWGDVREVELVWHYVRFDAELRSRRTPEQLEAVRTECIARIDEIEACGSEEAAFPTQPSRLCDWCEFNGICPARRHRTAVGGMAAEARVLDGGVALVDEWAVLDEERRRCKAELDDVEARIGQVRERLAAFAAAEGLESVAGSRHEVAVKREAAVEYPKTGSAEREAFEVALRAAGVFDAVAAPQHGRLVATWRDPAALTAEQRAALAPFFTEEERVTCTLRKGRDGE